MVSFKNIVFMLGAATAVVNADVVKVFNDFRQIDNDTNAFTKELKQWNGEILYALGLYTSQMAIEQDITTATADTKALNESISDLEAQAAIAYLNSTLEPDVSGAFSLLVSRKDDFAKNNLTQTVHDGIVGIKNQTDSFTAVLLKTAPKSQKAAGEALAKRFDDFFTAAIKAYAS